MIRSFRCRHTEALFHRQPTKRFGAGLHEPARRRLLILDAVTRLEDLRIPPSNRLEALKGDRKGWFSIRVNNQWRVCFRWRDGAAEDVEIVDYH
jgi:toxin HigB-1